MRMVKTRRINQDKGNKAGKTGGVKGVALPSGVTG